MPQLTNRAEKDLAALPGPMKDRALELIARLDTEPALGKKLLGKLQGLRSARLGRSHRIIYEVRQNAIVVLTIAARKDAYG
jgi:mRNA-degrading endonuclease RelE of RelBE toxin-antitoxin system